MLSSLGHPAPVLWRFRRRQKVRTPTVPRTLPKRPVMCPQPQDEDSHSYPRQGYGEPKATPCLAHEAPATAARKGGRMARGSDGYLCRRQLRVNSNAGTTRGPNKPNPIEATLGPSQQGLRPRIKKPYCTMHYQTLHEAQPGENKKHKKPSLKHAGPASTPELI